MNVRFPAFITGLIGLMAVTLPAQDEIPLQQPDEKRAAEAQSKELSAALQPSLREAARSTVRVWSGKKRLAYGTVVGDGSQIITKWSQISNAPDGLIIQAAGGQTKSARIRGVYEEEDLAVLSFAGSALPAVKWVEADLPLGSFIAMPQPDGRLAAFGVVSVLARSLRDTDRAFIGIVADSAHTGPGVKISQVQEDSGAKQAGLQKGDILLRINQRDVSGLLELQNALTGTAPGDTVQVIFSRGKKELSKNIVLGNRPELPQFNGRRLKAMERMGTRISRIRDDFTSAIQSDMDVDPEQIGGPIVNLQGEVVGLSLARADRTRSFFMPASEVVKLLASEATDPALAMAAGEEQVAKTESRPRRQRFLPQKPQPKRPDRARLRQHLEEMQRLMQFMEEGNGNAGRRPLKRMRGQTSVTSPAMPDPSPSIPDQAPAA